MNKQFLAALKVAKQEGYSDAVLDGMRALHSAKAWSIAKEADTEYHRGLRDGIVLAMEAIGYNRWETQRGMKSGMLNDSKKG